MELSDSLKKMAEEFLKRSVEVRISDTEKSYQFFICSEICREAAKRLKEQEPVEPKHIEGHTICGSCGHPVYKSLCERFCPGCGREVKWE